MFKGDVLIKFSSGLEIYGWVKNGTYLKAWSK